MTNIDISVLLWIQNHIRQDWLDPVMVFITHFFGKAGIFWIALTLLLILCKKTRAVGLTSFVSICLNVLAVNVIVKPIVARPRPYDVAQALIPLVEHLSDFSFPSGHTACAFACAVVLFLLLPKKFG
ncbi:MAG: phosphatase PAP2 family protein, partial [Lachnospiraceae bacterium]|nr:phosphatase PAP2 family protein [Lachnospiraceae bacterium]